MAEKNKKKSAALKQPVQENDLELTKQELQIIIQALSNMTVKVGQSAIYIRLIHKLSQMMQGQTDSKDAK